jgi:hypothetical protein
MDAIVDGNVGEVKRIVKTPDVNLNFLVDTQVCTHSISSHFKMLTAQVVIIIYAPVFCRAIGVPGWALVH